MTLGRHLAHWALELDAVRVTPEEPVEWSSGYYMPIEVDCNAFLSQAPLMDDITEGFEEYIQAQGIRPSHVVGVATGGIHYAARLAQKLNIAEAKYRHEDARKGKEEVIQGLPAKHFFGEPTVVIEDVISTGRSMKRAARAVRRYNGIAARGLAVFSYELEQSRERFAKMEPPLKTRALFTLQDIMDQASGRYMSEWERDSIENWRKDPFGWAGRH